MAQSAKKNQKLERDEKVQLELIPSNNHNPFWQSSLFNEVYLLNDVPHKYKDMWEHDEAGPFYEFCNQFRNLCEELKDTDFESWSERNTINRFIKPVLKMLGYAGTATQEPWAEDEPFTVKEAGENKTYKPDLIIVNDPKELKYIERKKSDEKVQEARSSVIIPVEAKYWGRIADINQNTSEDLKRADKKSEPDATKAFDFDEQCLKYMEILGKDFGILTDGKTWRLYNSELSADSYKRNFQFNLGHLLKHVNAGGLDSSERDYETFIENAKYFFHLFSKYSLYSINGEERFVDELLEYSKKYVNKIEDDLRGRFVKAMAFACNGYLRAIESDKSPVDLSTIRNVAESHLFNILFIKHCESRNILPLKQSPEYRKISVTNTIGKLEHFNPEKEEDNLNIPVLKRMFSKDFPYSPDGTELYDRLLKLTKIVQDGTKFSAEGFEIKGFKESIFSKEEWNFVSEYKLTNSEMVNIFFELGYCESDVVGRKFQQIPYNFFAPRQLGSIYESFLEFKIEKADEDMAFIKQQWSPANLKSDKIRRLNVPKVKRGKLFFTPDNKDRKATGSYYTPDNVVQFILGKTLDSTLKGCDAKALLKLKVCDPAMGSGHFLSGTINYLARIYLEKLSKELNDDVTTSIIEAKQLILHNCIFGVDINPRAVKLAKMSLWMESASANSSLESLSDQLFCVDSLLDDKVWKNISKAGGLDGVVGNPPYIRVHKQDAKVKEQLREKFLSVEGDFDAYVLFLENALNQLREGGKAGFIIPNKFLSRDYAAPARKLLQENATIKNVIDLGAATDIFDASVYPAILIYEKTKPSKDSKILSSASGKNAREFLMSDIKWTSVSQNSLNYAKWEFPVEDGATSIFAKLGELKSLSERYEYDLFCGTPRAKDYYEWAKYLSPGKPNGKSVVRYYVCKSIRPFELEWGSKISSLGEKLEKATFKINEAGLSSQLSSRFKKAPKILIRGNDYRLTSCLDEEGSAFVGVYGLIPKKETELATILAWTNSSVANYIFKRKNGSIGLSGGYFSVNAPHIDSLPTPIFSKEISAKLSKVLSSKLDGVSMIAQVDAILAEAFKITNSEMRAVYESLGPKFSGVSDAFFGKNKLKKAS